MKLSALGLGMLALWLGGCSITLQSAPPARVTWEEPVRGAATLAPARMAPRPEPARIAARPAPAPERAGGAAAHAPAVHPPSSAPRTPTYAGAARIARAVPPSAIARVPAGRAPEPVHSGVPMQFAAPTKAANSRGSARAAAIPSAHSAPSSNKEQLGSDSNTCSAYPCWTPAKAAPPRTLPEPRLTAERPRVHPPL